MDRFYSIISVNAAGLRSGQRFEAAIKFCEDNKADFSFLQETHLDISHTLHIKSNWQGEIAIAPGESQQNGILVLCNTNAPKIENLKTDKEGRYIIMRVKDSNDVLLNIYAPSGMNNTKKNDRTKFFKHLTKVLKNFKKPSENIILTGDFNNTLEKIDKTGNFTLCPSQTQLKTLLQEFDLEDVWRLENPEENFFTHVHKATETYARLDRAYTSTCIRQETKISHELNSFSDHMFAVKVVRNFTKNMKGPGYWHFNNSLLEDETYQNEIKSLWKNWQNSKNYFDNVSDWWEQGKKHIKDFTKMYTRTQTAKRTARKNSLKKRIRNIYKKVHKNPALQYFADDYTQQLFEIEQQEARGAKVRAKIRWELEGERCTKFFFEQAEKRRNSEHEMLSLKKENGQTTTDQKEILETVKNFYKKLYSKTEKVVTEPERKQSNSDTTFNPNSDWSKQSNSNLNFNPKLSNSGMSFNPKTNFNFKRRKQQQFLEKIDKTISEVNKAKCEQKISQNEIEKTIGTFENNKSPGSDGLTAEFYKTFRSILKADLESLYDEIGHTGLMTESMRKAILATLYKKGDRENIANWRPISLLNYDYKIYTKCIANKMQDSLRDIISDTQTAAVKGRTIIENLQLNRDIISYANKNNLEASIISLDQEKAFDRVDWNFLFQTLKKFGYGENLITHVKAMYNQIVSQVKVNGHMSQPFLLERGVRQGCPLSMLLYTIVAEVFLLNIQKNQKITGIEVNEKEIKASAFADDTTVYLGNNRSIEALGEQLREFENNTGVKYNKNKCIGLWLGENIDNTITPIGINWGSEKIRILGYTYGQNPTANQEENWGKIRDKIRKDIKKWNNLKLSLIGKKLIINQVLLSKFWYLAYVETPPTNIIQEIQTDIFNFLWNYRKVRVNRTTVTMPIKIGGLAILDIETQCKALQCSLIAKLIRDAPLQKAWTELMLYHLNMFRNACQGINIFKTYIQNTNKTNIPPFYRDILRAWADFTGNEIPAPTTLSEIYNEPLWYNSHSNDIPQRQKSKYLNKTPPAWARHTFLTVSDICAEEPGFISIEEFQDAHIPRKHIPNPKPADLLEIKKLVPREWKEKIMIGTANFEENQIKVKFFSETEKWKIDKAETLTCKTFYKTIFKRKIQPKYTEKKYYDWQKGKQENLLNDKDWEHLFTNLYKHTKQKESFDVIYRFLHFAHPTAQKIRNFKDNLKDLKCPRCGAVNETHLHWLYACPSSQNLLKYILALLEWMLPMDGPYDNDLEECLFTPLLRYSKELPEAKEIFEIYFITIRNLRRDASYGTNRTEKQELEFLKSLITERILFLKNKAIIENTLEEFSQSAWDVLLDFHGTRVILPNG